MRRVVSVVALMSLWGCGSDHGPEGTLIKPGTGVVGVPGDGYAVTASRAVPVSGGTLIVAKHGFAVAADPDRDKVFIASLSDRMVRTVALQPGDEPGRVVEDDSGRVHVATRSSGAVVSIDIPSAAVVDRRAVCPAPRGIAHDSATGLLHVACQTGELVSLPAAGGDAVRVLKLNRDLRDVLVQGTRLIVSRFKTAQMLVVDENGRVTSTVNAPDSNFGFGGGLDPNATRTPSVAWRMVPLANRKIGMIHQRGTPGMVSTSPSGYGGGFNPCGGGAIVEGTLSQLTVPEPDGATPPPDIAAPALNAMVGPSDVAVSPSGKVAIVSIGNAWFAVPPTTNNGELPPMAGPTRQRKPKIAIVDPGAGVPDPNNPNGCAFPSEDAEIEGEPTSVAFHGEQIVIQSREPAQLQVLGPNGFKISLSNDSRADTGLALFHMDAGPGLACASCHPEGMEDGRVWEFADLGSRRTQNLGGGIMDTAPFHWAGDLSDFPSLVHEVFESRMGSARPNHLQLAAFGKWIDTVPAVIPAVTDSAVVERGRALFESPEAGCATCHSGTQLTNNQTVDVGTGGFFQVPSLLGVGSRAPFMHTGCAPTLRDRFGACGGGDLHGTTSSLNVAQIDDLVAYLESL
jgi:hypothetical protein